MALEAKKKKKELSFMGGYFSITNLVCVGV